MKIDIWQRGLKGVLVIGITLLFYSSPASATHDPFPRAPGGIPGKGYVGDVCHDFSKCGYNGPLIWNPYTVSGFRNWLDEKALGNSAAPRNAQTFRGGANDFLDPVLL